MSINFISNGLFFHYFFSSGSFSFCSYMKKSDFRYIGISHCTLSAISFSDLYSLVVTHGQYSFVYCYKISFFDGYLQIQGVNKKYYEKNKKRAESEKKKMPLTCCCWKNPTTNEWHGKKWRFELFELNCIFINYIIKRQ